MKMPDEQSEYFARHREEGHPEYGPALRCPNCGGTDFYIYRGRLPGDEERKTIEPIADCKNCCGKSNWGYGIRTYCICTKKKYHEEDKAKDFKIDMKGKIIYRCACEDCDKEDEEGEGEEYHKIYEVTGYENTEYVDIDPPEFPEDPRYDVVENWYCPKHPKTRLEPFEQCVGWWDDVDEE
jgi:hypothetical protein